MGKLKKISTLCNRRDMIVEELQNNSDEKKKKALQSKLKALDKQIEQILSENEFTN